MITSDISNHNHNEVITMSALSRILDELTGGMTRLPPGRIRSCDLTRKSPCRLGDIGREVEELEDRIVPTLLGQQLFPSNYPWNQNIASAPVASNSTAIIDHIGASVTVHPDWGNDSPTNGTDPLYGIPVNIVHGNTAPKVNVIIDNYNSESDVVAVPMPTNPVIEGDYQDGPNPNGPGYGTNERGDSHLIIWDEDNNIAYEFYEAARPSDPVLGDGSPHTDGQWHAFQESVWYMNTDEFRSIGYTSADAAGLSILAGLARPDEGLPVSQGGQGAIDHALRFTLPDGDVNPQYIYPASHMVNETQSSLSLPLGARLRLASTPAINTLINSMGPEAKAIAIAMQQYGLILADIGSPMYVTGTSGSVDANNSLSLVWDMNDVLGLESLTASDFQVVNLTPIVTSLSVASGSAGNTISVVGQNFSGAAGHLSVFFGTTPASSMTVVNDSQLSVVVPSGSGTVNVTVQSGVNEIDDYSDNPDANVTAPIFGYGTSATSSADLFTFSDQTISGTNSTVSFASSTDTSGTTDLVTIVVKDTADNPVTGLSSNAFRLSLTGGTSTGSFGPVTETATHGTYTAAFTGLIAGTAATLTATVGGVGIETQSTVAVTPGVVSLSTSTTMVSPSSIPVGNTATLTLITRDAVGNPESTGGLAVAFGLAPGSAGGSFSSTTDNGNGTYSTTFTATSVGSDTFTAEIGSQPITSAASVVTVTASPPVGPPPPPVVPPPPSVSVNPNLVGFSDIAVGADAGGSSVVTVYNPNGSVAYTLNPFPGFTGGVRTAVGDFNGDGTQDVVVGTGPGITAEVKVFDGKTGALMFDVQPFETFQGGVFVAAGDIVGDGKSDLVITPDQSGGPRVEIYHGGDFTEMDNFYGIQDPGFRGGARAALGDINGDGHADLVVSAGFGGGPRISVYDGAALAQGQQVNLVGDFYAFSSELRNGAYVAVGDVNGDGHADLIFGAGPGGGPEVLVVNGETLLTQGAVAAVGDPIANFYAGDPNNRGGIRVAVKNLDGSANASVVTGAGPGGGSQVTAYVGKDLAVGSATTAFGMEAFPGFSGGVFVG